MKLIKKVISYVKYQGSIKEFAKENFQDEIASLEEMILANETLRADILQKNLELWLEPGGLIHLLTIPFNQRKYQARYRESHGTKVGTRGRPTKEIPQEDQKITLLYFLAKDLNYKFFPVMNTSEILALFKEGGIEALKARSIDARLFYRSFYSLFRLHVALQPAFLADAPKAFFTAQQNWEEPLLKIKVAEGAGNYLYLWESLSTIGKATLALLYREICSKP